MTSQHYVSRSPLWKVFSRRGLCALTAALFAVGPLVASAQANYDDHPLRDRLRLNLGGFKTDETNSSVRVDASNLGIGTIIELEDKLNVEDSATVFRLDGHYRFNRAHRIEWSWYNIVRDGQATLDETIEIGDDIFEVGLYMDTEVKTNIVKINYAWSFINVEKYEFYLGVGLNIRDTTFSFRGQNAEETTEFEDGGTVPLPTLAFGGRYNINSKMAILLRSENLNLDVQGYKGRFQDTSLLLEYDFTDHFGIGGGINVFNFTASGEINDDFEGEIESSYRGFLLYAKYQR